MGGATDDGQSVDFGETQSMNAVSHPDEICEIGRRLYARQLIAAFEGNISVRIGPNEVLCTPSLICKGFLTPDDLCVVDLDGRQLAGSRTRTSEILLHLVIYRERADVSAVVHAHPPHALAFALAHEPIPSRLLAEAEVFLGHVPTAPYETPGTAAFAETIQPLVRDATAILLANHGTVTYGPTLLDAWHKTEILEAYCRAIVLTRHLGTEQPLSAAQVQTLAELRQRLQTRGGLAVRGERFTSEAPHA